MPDALRLAVIMGGTSAERDVSLASGATIVTALAESYRVKPVQILADGCWEVPPGYVRETLPAAPAACFRGQGVPILRAVHDLLGEGLDVVFNALHGPMGEDGTVQGFLRAVGIPFTGPDVIPAAVTMDKRLTKQVLMAAGIRTPRFVAVRAADLCRGQVDWVELIERERSRLPLPWVLKPNRLGSSVGVGFLREPREAAARAREIVENWPPSAWQDDLLVEEAIEGRELTCGVLEPDGEPRALPPVEIRPRTSAFFDYRAKYTPGASEEICPAPLAPHEEAAVKETAVRVHRLFECAPLSRTDMFLTPGGELQVLEVNTLPGMTATSLIPLAASRAGIPLVDLLSSLVEHALARARGRVAVAHLEEALP